MAIDYQAFTLFYVDYYDKLSNLLDAIRALNVASRELSGSFFCCWKRPINLNLLVR